MLDINGVAALVENVTNGQSCCSSRKADAGLSPTSEFLAVVE
jgi:hypothetical protein